MEARCFELIVWNESLRVIINDHWIGLVNIKNSIESTVFPHHYIHS